MTSDLSIFATRLREFICICADELGQDPGLYDQMWDQHADAEFNAMALVLFALQFTHNEPYRKFCKARNVHPNEATHWKQIPAMPTSAFKELELTSLPPEQRLTVFHSSGTTEQQPSRHFHNSESLAIYETSLLTFFKLHFESVQRLLILTPPPGHAPHSSLVHMFEIVRDEFASQSRPFIGGVKADGAWTLDTNAATQALDNASRTSTPLTVMGAAFSFVHLLDHMVENKMSFRLPHNSRVFETGGYKGRSCILTKSELHKLVTERLGIPESHIICEYGMSELSSQAYDLGIQNSKFNTQNLDRKFYFPPWARAQIISPETGLEVADGEIGLIRVFDLANVFSVMAIQTEDLGVRRGNGFELLGRTEHAEPRGCSLMAV